MLKSASKQHVMQVLEAPASSPRGVNAANAEGIVWFQTEMQM